MKGLLLIFLAILLPFSEIAQAQINQDSIKLRMDVTPNPTYNQVETGKSYIFLVSMENINIILSEGDVVEQPDSRFSGNLTVHAQYILGKSGYITYGSNSMIYGSTIDRWERSYSVGLPRIGQTVNVSLPYYCSHSYDPKNATIGEWLKLVLKITVHIEVYSGQEQNKTFRNGPEIRSHEATYFIINEEKIQYVKEKSLEIENEISSVTSYRDLIENMTGQAFNIDLSGPMNDYNRIKALVDGGDYVSAMNETRNWWYDLKRDLIDSLLNNYESYAGFKATAVQYRDQLDTAQIELGQVNAMNQYYLVGIAGLASLSTFLFLAPRQRTMKRRIEPMRPDEGEKKEPPQKHEEPEKLEEPREREEPREPEQLEEQIKPRKRTGTPIGKDTDIEKARSLLGI